MIPSLETERLVLRPMTMTDWPAYLELMMSERACFMGGPHDTAAAWGLFCNDAAQWPLMGHGALMIDDRDGVCLGQVGIIPRLVDYDSSDRLFRFFGKERVAVRCGASDKTRDEVRKT